MTDIGSKRKDLLNAVDWTRPELDSVSRSEDPATALIHHLDAPPRPRFRFEPRKKTDIIAFLKAHYPAWRAFDTSEADRLADLSLDDAKQPRALRDVAALGQAWWATSDPAYGSAFETFYLNTATGEMFNWDSFNGSQGSLELSAYFLLQDCPEFTADGRIAFLDHLRAITENAWDVHTSQWPLTMLGPEGHNWYLHGMHVLPFFGLLFPEFRRSAFFLRTGWSVVEEHLRGHYKTDGGARETTLGYQAGSIRNLWDLYLVAQRNGYPVSAGFADRLLNATIFLLRLMSPQAGLPSYGDGGHKPGQLTHVAALAAALTGNGECKWYAEYCRQHQPQTGDADSDVLPLCAFWDVGLTGAQTYAATRSHNPNHTSVLMGPTGYAALRNGATANSAYAAVAAADRGPIVTSHGHNDVFALEVHADGIRFAGEMGCAPYGTTRGREYDQTTKAHNCFTVDDLEQAHIVDEWRWKSHVIPCVRRWITEPTHDVFHGVHEGFYRYPEQPILHARKIVFLKDDPPCWIVFDWLEAEGKHDCSAYFHGCVPGTIKGKAVLLSAGNDRRLWISPPEDSTAVPHRVDSDGLTAYRNERNLDPETTPCFAFRGPAVGSTCFAWALVPASAQEPTPQVHSIPVRLNGTDATAADATAIQITHGHRVDTVCLSHKEWDGDLAFGNDSLFGLLAIRRQDSDGTVVFKADHRVTDGRVG